MDEQKEYELRCKIQNKVSGSEMNVSDYVKSTCDNIKENENNIIENHMYSSISLQKSVYNKIKSRF